MEKAMKKIRNILYPSPEWRWMGGYMRRYAGGMVFYLSVGILGVLMGLFVSVAQKDLINAVTAQNRIPAVILRAAGWVILLAVGQILMGAVSTWISTRINVRVVNEIRADIFRRMIAAQWSSLTAYRSGDLINRLEGDVNTVAGGAVGLLPTMITRFLQFAGAFGIILAHDPVMALLALLSAPVLLLSSRPLVRVLRRHNERTRELNGRILSLSGEAFRGVAVIKAFGLGGAYCHALGDLLVEYRTVRLAHSRVSVAMRVLLGLLGLVAGYACYGLGVWRLYTGVIDFGEMTLFLSLAGTLSGAFSSLVHMVPGVISVATAAARVMEVAELPAEQDRDAEAACDLLTRVKRTNGGIGLRAREVSCGYTEDGRDILMNVSFSIAPGECIALVGPSGSGKSTLFKLILALIAPSSGTLEMVAEDGTALPVSDSTRRLCAYVPQDPCLLAGTIADELDRVRADATDHDISQALQAADAEDFVHALPDGLRTPLSEGGRNLSEGQCQRLSIARAVLRDAPLLLLDEATSALDPETEARVLQRLMGENPCRTCIFSTHRPAMLAYADRIFRVSDGHITELTSPAAAFSCEEEQPVLSASPAKK